MDSTFRALLITFAVLVTILTAVTGMALKSFTAAKDSADLVNTSHATVAELTAVLSSLQSAEGSVRSYLLTESDEDLRSYRNAFNALGEHLEVTKALMAPYPDQQAPLQELEAMMLERVQLARELTTAKRQGDESTVEQMLTEDAQGDGSFAIGRQVQRLRSYFISELSRLDTLAFNRDRNARRSLYLGSSLSFLTIMGSVWFIRDSLNHRRLASSLLEESNQDLEAQVATRTADLDEKIRELSTQNLENAWRNQALNHQLRYNNRIIEAVSELVLVVTKVGNITRTNAAVEKSTGFENAHLANAPLHQLVSAPRSDVSADRALPLTITNALKHGFDLLDETVEVTTKAQTPLVAKLSLFPLRDSDQVIGAVITLRLSPPTSSAS